MNAQEFRKAAHAAVDDIADYYERLAKDEFDVKSHVQPGYLAKAMNRHSPPEDSDDFDTIRSDFFRLIMPGITHWQSPNFFAYFPANTSFEAILGDMYASAVSNPGFNAGLYFLHMMCGNPTYLVQWACSPACTELEACVMDWCCHMLGLDDAFLTSNGVGGGIIMGSASEACLTAAIGAREKALNVLAMRGRNDVNKSSALAGARVTYTSRLVMYGSTQTHSLGAKAALILGLTWRAVPVHKEDDFALRGEALRTSIELDLQNGLVPFMVIGTCGTTSSGAIDALAEIGNVASSYDTMTFYVDAAWAGTFLVCLEFRERCQLNHINLYADVFNTNLHKGGLVNFDCSTLFVRDRKLLTNALDVTPPYLRTKEADAGSVIDYRNWQIALGRKFRSLKVWFALRGIGVKGFQAHLRKADTLAQEVEQLICQSESFELVAPRSFGLVTFRLIEQKSSLDETNELNRRFAAALNERFDIILTSTVLPGDVHCLRWATGSPLSQQSHIRKTWGVVQAVADEVLKTTKTRRLT